MSADNLPGTVPADDDRPGIPLDWDDNEHRADVLFLDAARDGAPPPRTTARAGRGGRPPAGRRGC